MVKSLQIYRTDWSISFREGRSASEIEFSIVEDSTIEIEIDARYGCGSQRFYLPKEDVTELLRWLKEGGFDGK